MLAVAFGNQACLKKEEMQACVVKALALIF